MIPKHFLDNLKKKKNKKILFNNKYGCNIKCYKSKSNEYLLPSIPKIFNHTNIFSKITITIRFLKLNSNGSIDKNLSKTLNIRNSIGKIEFDSLYEAIYSLNKYIEKYDIKYITHVDIVFGQGTTWVMPNNQRNLIDIGNVYSTEILLLNIGRKETFIGRLGFYGNGQGTSTIRGSCTLNIFNLGALPIIDSLSILQSEDSLQLDNRLIINNFFWIGKFALNLYYPTEDSDPVIAPQYSSPDDIFNKNKNEYTIKDTTTLEQISDWTLTRRPEIEIINVWIELEDPPVKTTEPNKGKSLIDNPVLKTPIFFYKCSCNVKIFYCPI